MNIKLLEALRRAEPEWVSSEVLRQPSGVSRAAISKQIRVLQGLGYEIDSSPRKGYRLIRDPDSLRAEVMQAFLHGTRFADGVYVYKDVTASTNDDIRLLAREGAPEGSVVVSEVQEAGRGRRGRAWFGRAGDSLQFSVLLRPPLPPQDATLLPLLAATAIYRALRELGVDGVEIKWPNDVLIRGRKVCGILCEMSVDMEGIQYAMLGIGMNVNTPGEQFPRELWEIACSLASETGTPWRRSNVLTAVLRHMETLVQQTWDGEPSEILSGWREGAVTLGQQVNVEMGNGKILRGTAEDVNEQGALLVRDNEGVLHTLYSGEVSLGT
jgi:BirA family biotin operon repressor/biotin-[acetyl-CoA-carboxylase] ligase